MLEMNFFFHHIYALRPLLVHFFVFRNSNANIQSARSLRVQIKALKVSTYTTLLGW